MGAIAGERGMTDGQISMNLRGSKRVWMGLGMAAGLGLAVAHAQAPLPADHAERLTRGLGIFESRVRSILVGQCLKCHGGEKTKGGLDLATREGLLKGGENGLAVVPFEPGQGRLLGSVRHETEPHMPEKGEKLAASDLRSIEEWIRNGAPYDGPLVAGRKPAKDPAKVTAEDRQWWAFQPLGRPEVPFEPGEAGRVNPVDAFLRAKGRAKGVGMAPLAPPRVQVRRAHLDLTGLPPSSSEIEAFERDPGRDAWDRLVSGLLASPRHGERWARHWLDVARFAESSGFEHDYDREGAFHFRDFVIRALNDDLPFDRFLQWQLAGDEFEPENPWALAATGFLGAGVFPTQITANEVERTRYDALDDMLSTTGSAFLGLTVGCARCHEHKYDPIPTADYYRMLSTFTTTVRSVLDLDLDPAATRERVRRWEEERGPLVRDVEEHERALAPRFESWLVAGARDVGGPVWVLPDWTNVVAKSGATFRRMDDGSHLVEGKTADHDEYTFSGTTTVRRVTGLRLDALSDPSLPKGGPGRADNGNFGLSRIRFLVGTAGGVGAPREVVPARAVADFEQNAETLSVASALDDRKSTGWAVDGRIGSSHRAVFVFAEPVVIEPGAVVTVRLEFQVNSRHNLGRPRLSLLDGLEPGLDGEVLPPGVASVLGRRDRPAFVERLTDDERRAMWDWWKRRDTGWRARTLAVSAHEARKPDGRTKVLVCAEGYPALRMHTQGADFFEATYQLKRGSTELKNGIARPGFLQVLMPPAVEGATEPWGWSPPAGARFSGRRRALAAWLTDVESGAGGLVARVIVNRLWQHHFGRGIVATPNDFGRTGTPPTHPELLDWLAGELVRGGWKLKSIHRLLMTSDAYRQAAVVEPASVERDPDNQLFLRRVPFRLEGEALRDAILHVSGRLDPTMYGPGTKDERSRRRSIYFTVKRSQLVGSMVVFDQPEPLVSQGSRPTTTVAPQALLLLNGPQVREWAGALADRLISPGGGTSERVQRAYLDVLGRRPGPGELSDSVHFLEAQAARYRSSGGDDPGRAAMVDFCQVMFGLNEFAYLP